jgi:hypothetical protein
VVYVSILAFCEKESFDIKSGSDNTAISGRGFLGLPQNGVSCHKPVPIFEYCRSPVPIHPLTVVGVGKYGRDFRCRTLRSQLAIRPSRRVPMALHNYFILVSINLGKIDVM